jgi:ribosomal protein S17E
LNCETYKDLVSKFTDVVPFIESKKIRQVIFGYLNPKRQQTIQKFMMNELFETLEKSGFEKKRFLAACSDEIILSFNY